MKKVTSKKPEATMTKPTKRKIGMAMQKKFTKMKLSNMGNAFALLVHKAAGRATCANSGTTVTQIRVKHSGTKQKYFRLPLQLRTAALEQASQRRPGGGSTPPPPASCSAGGASPPARGFRQAVFRALPYEGRVRRDVRS